MSDDEVDTIIPPESEENQGEPQGQENQGQAGEERKEEALRESEDQGEPANEDESLPGASNFEEQGEPVNEEPSPEVSTSEDQGEAVNEEPIPGVSTFDDQEEPVNEEESLPGVSTTEEQDEPVNEEEGAKGTLPEDDQGQPGIENETLPGASTSEDQREPRSQVEQGNEPSSQVKTLADQGEPGNEDEIFSSEDQREPRSQVEQGNEPSSQVKTLADQGEPGNEDEIFSSEDQAEPRMEEDQAAETSAGVKTSDGGQERRLSESPGSEPHGAVAAGTTASSSEPLAARADSEQHENPDVINVSLRTDDSAPTDVSAGGGPPPAPQKAFLGGYRHKLTGTEYHHAASQTPRRARPGRGVDVVSRDAQTAEQVLQAQQCDSSVTTQMTRVGCYISNMKDRLLSPGHYITADEYHHTRLKAVIRLQAHTRRWLSCRAVDRLRQERDRRLAWLDLQERRRHEERAEQLQDSHSRWMQPRKREDLNLLYNALEKWRSDKERQINATLRGAERKAALCSLLEQETQYIATIGRHGIAIRSNNYNKAVRKFLDKSSTAHQWRAADGRLIEMDTPDTIRARELGDLYDCVAMSPVSPEQRLDILLCLKQTVEVKPPATGRKVQRLMFATLGPGAPVPADSGHCGADRQGGGPDEAAGEGGQPGRAAQEAVHVLPAVHPHAGFQPGGGQAPQSAAEHGAAEERRVPVPRLPAPPGLGPLPLLRPLPPEPPLPGLHPAQEHRRQPRRLLLLQVHAEAAEGRRASAQQGQHHPFHPAGGQSKNNFCIDSVAQMSFAFKAGLCGPSGGGHPVPGGGHLGVPLGPERLQRPVQLGPGPLGPPEGLEPLELRPALQRRDGRSPPGGGLAQGVRRARGPQRGAQTPAGAPPLQPDPHHGRPLGQSRRRRRCRRPEARSPQEVTKRRCY
ncbi:IQ motif and ubiquitin-like domain-containing protein isoform X5 [Syngnathus scovelli]|uniref:IQ motif and ubiquitin-like domain-containing protein isoform X5 n=1 Tax=Syngnathus scovelli TaxID=161590 RepID=UPI00210F25E9|nr:IQ and ubiquitin-like domain-containing protein isoform X3 [Syngnathus scovelli]